MQWNTAATILTAGRLGWRFELPHKIRTDVGELLLLGTDPPAAVKHAVEEAVVRWRAANVLQHHEPTSALVRPGNPPITRQPSDVVPHMEAQWVRAAAAADVQTAPEVFSALLAGKGCKRPTTWDPKYAHYLTSATAGKQWPQAKVAAVKNSGWTNDDRCKLCNDCAGTLDHRHECRHITSAIPANEKPGAVLKAEIGMKNTRLRLCQTRGIGGFRVPAPPPPPQEWVVWHKTPHDSIDESQLTWYVDASMIDAPLLNELSGSALASWPWPPTDPSTWRPQAALHHTSPRLGRRKLTPSEWCWLAPSSTRPSSPTATPMS